LKDMSGNVWEWTCSAWQNEFDTSKQSEHKEQHCVTEEKNSLARVMRGGSWDVDADYARSSARGGNDPGFRDVSVGFRVLCASPIE